MDRFLAGIERRAFRIAQLATGDAEEALDLVQEAMLKLVQRYRSKAESEWKPLFHRILQNGILDWHRRSAIRRRWRRWFGARDEDQEDDPLDSIPDTATPTPAEQAARQDAATRLDAAVRALPLRQQQAFLLRAWEELDVAETARIMGCSAGSVKRHYFRAVHALRKRLGEDWP